MTRPPTGPSPRPPPARGPTAASDAGRGRSLRRRPGPSALCYSRSSLLTRAPSPEADHPATADRPCGAGASAFARLRTPENVSLLNRRLHTLERDQKTYIGINQTCLIRTMNMPLIVTCRPGVHGPRSGRAGPPASCRPWPGAITVTRRWRMPPISVEVSVERAVLHQALADPRLVAGAVPEADDVALRLVRAVETGPLASQLPEAVRGGVLAARRGRPGPARPARPG